MGIGVLRRKIEFAVVILIGVMAFQLHQVNEDNRAIRKEMEEIYILHIHQAKQIDVLLNLRIRESREEEQNWLRKTRQEYSDG